MRKATDDGRCADCGTTAPGLYWRSEYRVLFADTPGIAPLEPGDMGEPVRCDACEIAWRERADSAAD